MKGMSSKICGCVWRLETRDRITNVIIDGAKLVTSGDSAVNVDAQTKRERKRNHYKSKSPRTPPCKDIPDHQHWPMNEFLGIDCP